jgi:hypothetical protein
MFRELDRTPLDEDRRDLDAIDIRSQAALALDRYRTLNVVTLSCVSYGHALRALTQDLTHQQHRSCAAE